MYFYKRNFLFIIVTIFLINYFCCYASAQQVDTLLSKKIFKRVLLKKGAIVRVIWNAKCEIEVFYNREQVPSTLNYKSPVDFEQSYAWFS